MRPMGPPGLAVDRDLLDRVLFPAADALVRLGYFSFEVEGLEHVPRQGRVVYAPNHAGWFPLDAFFLTYAVAGGHGLERAPFFATQEAALAIPGLGGLLRRAGGLPAPWFRRPERLPDEVISCAVFPEGVRGNCKPLWEAYRMKPWNRGFVRVALARGAPIVPTAVLGGEECVPVAWTVRALEPLVGSIFGLPLSLVPLPSRWKIVFHEPVALEAEGREALADPDFSSRVAARLQGTVQATLDRLAWRYPLGRLSTFVAGLRQR
jgi:1-acyl-sn-glycerol-3-phosphate acyltransferase